MRRVETGAGLNPLTDTLTSAWDAMRANFGLAGSAAVPHGWAAPAPHTRYCYLLRWSLRGIFSRQYWQLTVRKLTNGFRLVWFLVLKEHTWLSLS